MLTFYLIDGRTPLGKRIDFLIVFLKPAGCLLWVTLGLTLFFQSNLCADPSLVIGQFSSLDPAIGLPEPWETQTFQGIDRHTDYSVVRIEDRAVIQAHSTAGASGLIRNLDIDPNRYPWLYWQWRISGTLEKGDVTTKQGDDCAARIYVAFEFVAEGKSFWERFRYKAACIAAGKQLPGSALTYIWGNRATPGAIINSPYIKQSKMVVVQSGNGLVGQWVNEKRNIIKDYHAAFGQDPPRITGIAIMTDTDNTGSSTTAYYGDIRLGASMPLSFNARTLHGLP